MEAGGSIFGATFVVGVVVGMSILAVGLHLVNISLGVSGNQQAEVDARRIAQALEVIDHRDNATMDVKFSGSYSEITLQNESVTLSAEGGELSQDVRLVSPVGNSTVSDVESVCVAHTTETIELQEQCNGEE